LFPFTTFLCVGDEIFLKGGFRVESLRGGLTQAEFADRLDVDRKTVGQWERGERVPSGTVLLRMASEFGADVGYILTGKRGGVAPLLPPDEEELLAHYRAAHSDARERIRQIAATAANSPKREPKEKKPKSSVKIGVMHGQYIQAPGGMTINGDHAFSMPPPDPNTKPKKPK
jgi:transcriptional regulator with XRE-family HTH domain